MKKFRQSSAVALTLGMLFTSVPYAALAETPAVTTSTMSQNQAIEIVKKFITIPEGYKLRDANFHDAKDGQGPYGRGSVWMINFGKEDRRDSGSLNVVVDAKSGTLLNFDFWLREDSTSENAISREEAKVKAKEYLKQFAPDKVSQVQELEMADKFFMYGPYGPRDSMQTFRFVRMVDGIPYQTDGISIRVNGKGELRGYSYNWTENVQFPTTKASITEAQAKEAFKNAIDVQLYYQRIYKPYDSMNQEAQLVYGPWGPYYEHGPLPMIDATKGVAIGRDGNVVTVKSPAEMKALTDKPGEAKTTKEITKEVALELIASYNLGLDGYTLQSTSFSSYNASENVWRFNYQKGESSDYRSIRHISISIDAKTGELREFYRPEYREGKIEFPQNPAISADQARQTAIDFVKKAIPTKTHQIALNTAMDTKMGFKMGPGYGFEFVRLVDGVPVRDTSMRITIDPNTGEVREFMSMWSWDPKMKFPPKTNVITLEKAKEKYLEKYTLRLQYVPIYDQGNPYEPGKIKGVALVIAPMMNGPLAVLNASTGEWISVYGDRPAEPVEIQDIKGHWAEKQLNYLVERGVFAVKDGKLNPDAGVTRAEMIKSLMMIVNGPRRAEEKATFDDVPKTDPNFEFIEEAAARKWIDKNTKTFRPGDTMTREELADLVTAALGYAKLSDAKNTFKNTYPDVAADGKYMGDIAIVSGLGIMIGWEGNFMPKQHVTKAQAAIVMTKVLDQLKEKQDYPYYISK